MNEISCCKISVIWIVLNTHILFLSQINALTRPFYSPTQWTIGCWWGKKGNLAIVNFEYISYDKFFNIRDPQTPSFDCHLTGHLFSQASSFLSFRVLMRILQINCNQPEETNINFIVIYISNPILYSLFASRPLLCCDFYHMSQILQRLFQNRLHL